MLLPSDLQLLIVEDQRFDAMVLRKLLDAPGIGAGRVDHAETLAAAIDLMAQHAYDAVLLDLGLPDSDGVPAVQRLRELHPDVTVIVLTGREDELTGLEAMAAGAQDKLGKIGLDAEHLSRSLHYAIERQRLKADLRQRASENEALFDNNPFPVFVYDLETLGFLAVNEAALRSYGYTRDEFLALNLLAIPLNQDRARVYAAVKLSRSGVKRTEEWRHRRKDGSVFDVEVNAQSIDFRGRPARIVVARDITVRKRAIENLEISERRFRKLFQYSLGLICTHDLQGTVLSINPAAAEALGCSVAELMGRKLTDMMAPRARPAFADYLKRIAENGTDSGLLHLIASDGQPRVWQYHNMLDDEADEPYVLGHAQDITEQRNYEKRLRDWSIRDPLTGCYNRRFLEEHAASIGPDELWGCIVIDLDHFKQINDTFGHARGDEVLIGFGRFLQDHARADDIVVRTGGDEFLILLIGAGEETTAAVASRLREDAPAQAPSGFTIGWAVRANGEKLENAISNADKQLYSVRLEQRGPSMPTPLPLP